MSELLQTNPGAYTDWERRPTINLRPRTAERIGRFYSTAVEELRMLDDAGYDTSDLVPFHVVATLLGVPQELLLQWYREERFDAVDTGILGLWVSHVTLAQLRGQR